MMVMLPLRVMAFTQTSCEMHDQSSQAMEGHGMHMMHQMDEAVQTDADESRNSDCCDNDTSCTGDCGLGMSLSFITPPAVMLPVVNKAAFNSLVNNNPVLRDPAPPVRPPANLQI